MTQELQAPGPGVVYTETVVYSAPEAFVHEAPYQIAIVELSGNRRLTVRILGDRVAIGEKVNFVEYRNGVPYYRKSAG